MVSKNETLKFLTDFFLMWQLIQQPHCKQFKTI